MNSDNKDLLIDEDDVRGGVFKHIKSGGYYRVIGFGIIEATNTHAVIYKHMASSVIWVRPSSEFFDGRFEFVGKQKD